MPHSITVGIQGCAHAPTPVCVRMQEFDHLYDYLKGTPAAERRPCAAVKVKYYKASGGDWTVKDKSIPLRTAQHVRAPTVRLPPSALLPCLVALRWTLALNTGATVLPSVGRTALLAAGRQDV